MWFLGSTEKNLQNDDVTLHHSIGGSDITKRTHLPNGDHLNGKPPWHSHESHADQEGGGEDGRVVRPLWREARKELQLGVDWAGVFTLIG